MNPQFPQKETGGEHTHGNSVSLLFYYLLILHSSYRTTGCATSDLSVKYLHMVNWTSLYNYPHFACWFSCLI